LAVDTYFAKAVGSPVRIDQLYKDITCAVGCTVTTGTPITGTKTNIDFSIFPPAADRDSGHLVEQLPDGRLLIAGGSDPNSPSLGPLASADIYQPPTNIFTAAGPMSVARFRLGSALLTTGPNAGKVLVIGGDSLFAPGDEQKTTELFDPATNTFTGS